MDFGEILKRNNEMQNIIDAKVLDDNASLTYDEVIFILGNIIDDLTEVGNGITDEQLHDDVKSLMMVKEYIETQCQKKGE